MRIRLVNPNSDPGVTRAMLLAAEKFAPIGIHVVATTSSRAVSLITNPDELADAAQHMIKLFESGLDPLDGVIVAAFGDPGVDALQGSLEVPVIGIAQAALTDAAARGPYSIVSTTTQLVDSIRDRAIELNCERDLVSIRITPGDPAALMEDTAALDDALFAAAQQCIRCDGANAIVVGGGPLVESAVRLAPRLTVPIVHPIAAAMSQIAELIHIRAIGGSASR